MTMLRKDLDDLDTNGTKGDWCFLNNDELIAIRYGDSAFEGTTIIPIAENAMQGKPHWQWNENKEAPTLSPSILVHPNPGWSAGWHGWMRDGKLMEA
jgi:hypothetical protein